MTLSADRGREEEQVGNLLGALCLAVNDRVGQAIGAAAGHSDTAAAALSALHHFLTAPSIDLLSQVLGLTHSGTVRLVDRLEAAGQVQREPGSDGRSTAVTLTAAGRRTARRVSEARHSALLNILAALPQDERLEFSRLAGEILASMVRPAGATRWICRLCDTTVCGREEGRCPVAIASGQTPRAKQVEQME